MKPLLRLGAVVALCLAPHFVPATIMVPLAPVELSGRAELILRGTVTSKVCLKDPEGRIYTKIAFKVGEVWKGALATNDFTIVHAGGTVGDERTVVDGEATYEVGEELVTFLRLNHRGEGVSIGLAQGKFTVWKDDTNGESFAYNLFHGQPKGSESPANEALRAAAGKSKRLPVSELRSRTTGAAR